MVEIRAVEAKQVLDSRRQPTVSCRVELADGAVGQASVPSGASVGQYEAVALPARTAIKNINQIIAPKLIGQSVNDQTKIDQLMIALDATENKSKLGANATLAVSLAVCRAAAASQKKPLYQYLAQFFSVSPKLPLPFFNLLNGGRHSPPGRSVDIQEIMAVPIRGASFQERLQIGAAVGRALKAIFQEQNWPLEFGDESGLLAPVKTNEAAINLLVRAIQKAGHEGRVLIALDMAASEFYHQDNYQFSREGRRLTREEMLDLYQQWLEKYPIFSFEDPFSENDWHGFTEMTRGLGHQVQIIGDDLYATNLVKVQQGIELKATNAVLIKPNQIGTLTETTAVMKVISEAGWKMMISHRSGETADSFIADLAVASGCGQIKAGPPSGEVNPPAGVERMAKYQRLLEIEKELVS